MIALAPVPQDVAPTIFALLFVALMYAVFGAICAVVAPGRGRSPVGWFFIGFFTQCIGVILVFLLPNLKLEEERQRRQREETRKLRELLKKERQTQDQRHDVHRSRLGVHDRALGLDTSSAEQELLAAPSASSDAPPPPPPPLPPSPPPPAETAWFFAQGGQQQGPVPSSRLRQLWIDQRIDDQTLVWREGMSEWATITEVVDLLDGGSRS